MTIKTLFNYILQYATTLGFIVVVIYYVGKPHAENFIDQTVAGKFDAVEMDIKTLTTAQQALIAVIEKQTRKNEDNADVNIKILELIQQMQDTAQ